jgi:peptidoglycan/LPS O-acetylase OafA/YrhL
LSRGRASTLSPSGFGGASFFVISGFYMQLIIAENNISGKDKITNFYKSRIARIFPTYWLIAVFNLNISRHEKLLFYWPGIFILCLN